MRTYIHGAKKRHWHTFLLFYFVTIFLSPFVHSHKLSHDDHDVGKIHHDLTLKVAATHNHAGRWQSENLFATGANSTDFSKHDHNSDQHSHFQKNLLLKSKRRVGGLEGHKSFLLQAVSNRLAFKKVFCKIPNQLSPVTPPSKLEFVFVATNLPPPTV